MKYIKLYELYVTKLGSRTTNPEEELLYASLEGNLNHVKKMIHIEKVKPTYRKNTAIRNAVIGNNIEVVKFLLRYKNIERGIENDLIEAAARYGRLEIIKLLLKDGRFNTSGYLNSPIRFAEERGYDDIVYLLLNQPEVYSKLSEEEIKKYAKGIPLVKDMVKRMNEDNFIEDLKHEMALMLEIEKSEVDIEMINKIIKSGNLPTERDLISAAAFGHVELVKLFIEKYKIDPTAFDNQAIRIAANNNNIEVVEYLLGFEEVDPNTKDGKAIKISAEKGHIKIVKLLLQDDRVDPSVESNYPIQMASFYGHVSIVNMLLKHPKVDPSERNNFAIRAAVEYGHVAIVNLLMKDERVDPSDNGNQAIKKASEKGYHNIVSLLLRDERVDPSVDRNVVINNTIDSGEIDLTKQLLKDKRIDPSDNYNYILNKILRDNKDEKELILQLLSDERVREKLSEKELLKITKPYVGDMLTKLNQ